MTIKHVFSLIQSSSTIMRSSEYTKNQYPSYQLLRNYFQQYHMSNMTDVFQETGTGSLLCFFWLGPCCSSFQFSVLCFILFVFVLCLVYPMLPVSLNCPLLIVPSVFSNVYLWDMSLRLIAKNNFLPYLLFLFLVEVKTSV